MASNKCCATVFDITTKRNRKCKLHKHFRDYCYIHSRKLYENVAITIQRIWRGYKKRTKLKTLFYNLPEEIQFEVLNYVRHDHYMEKIWIPSMCKVYKNRLDLFYKLQKQIMDQFVVFEISDDDYKNNMSLLRLEIKNTQSKLKLLTF